MAENTLLPSQETFLPWLYARRTEDVYRPPKPTKAGMWEIILDDTEIDQAWQAIAQATRKGQLGYMSQVSTMSPVHIEKNPYDGTTVIRIDRMILYVHTYNVEDRDDVLRVLNGLRQIGIQKKIFYEKDISHPNISSHYPYPRAFRLGWAREGKIELRIPEVLKAAHFHTCNDKLCRPLFCYKCDAVYCEHHFSIRKIDLCDACVPLIYGMPENGHINGCSGCKPRTCWICFKRLCAHEFRRYPYKVRSEVCLSCEQALLEGKQKDQRD